MSSAANIIDSYPLSPMQQGMLYHALSEPHSGVDIEQLVITLSEQVDAARLRSAWERLVARHPILRTGFRVTDDGPRQEVHQTVELEWQSDDWSAEPGESREARFAAWLKTDRARGFQMDRAPLARFQLLRFAPEEYRLVWTFHHALLDGRSFPILLEEAFAFYANPTAAEPPLPRPFKEFIAFLETLDLAPAEAFWRARLAGFTAPTPLVVENLPGCSGRHEQGDAELALPPHVTNALRQFANQNRVTLNTLVQGAWAILLSRYSREEDVCFGATRAGRHGTVEGAAEMVGLFINTIPVRVRVPHAEHISDWLRKLREFWVDARSYEHTPLAKVQSWSDLPKGQSLFQTLVVFENYDLSTHFRSRPGPWAHRHVRLYEQTNFPICLAAYAGESLRLVAEYDRSHLDADTVRRMLDHVATILQGFAGGAQTIGELPMLPPGEHSALLTMWDRPPSSRPSDKTLHALFAEQVARTPEATALVQDGTRITYAELDRRATLVAQHLVHAGAGPETIVGLCLERTPDLVVGLLGILKANAAYLPIDLAYPAERLAYMLEDAKAPILLTQQKLATQLPPLRDARVLNIEELADLSNPPTLADGNPDQLCYVIYTSGSTGKPKGCCVTHRNVTRLFSATDDWFHFGPQDVWTLFHSTAFDFSVWEIWGALLHGGTLVVVPFATSRSPEAFRQLLAQERVTVLNQTPSAFRQLIAADAEAGGKELHLRLVIFGGEALEMRSLEPWFDLHGDTQPQLVNMYGITETTVHVTYRPLHARDTRGGSVIGEPIPDLRLYILDPHLKPVPIGVPGELYVGGEGLARGYLHRPELTAERFIPDPFRPGERLYKTGDSARFLPGPDIEYLGRIDQQVKIRGFRIELGEIESVLLQHPAVREAAVLPRPDAAGGKRLVAWLVCAGAMPATAELRQHLKTFLPDYMIPAAFVRVDRMPLTNNGKLDVRALPEPIDERPTLRGEFVAPRSANEKALAEIWQRVLKVAAVGIHDNFFELGGDSILSIVVVAQARQAGLTITPKDLFDRPTIAELAQDSSRSALARLPELPAEGDVPLTPIQQWFFAQNFVDPHHWNQSFTFELKSPLTAATLAPALAKLFAAHPVFRLRYEPQANGWRQSFGPLPSPQSAIALSPHDLQSSLRLDGVLARFAPHGRALTIAMHHLIVDGVSWRVLLQDLDAALAGKPLPPSTTGFHTWAAALNSSVVTDRLADEIPHWERVLAVPKAALPRDREGGNNLELAAETIAVSLDAKETAALQRSLTAHGGRLHEALLAALAEAIIPWSGSAELVVDVEGHGREEALLAELTGSTHTADLSHTVGWFTTIYPVLLRKEASPAATLSAAREHLSTVPRTGFGYSILHSRGRLPASDAELLFNFLGHFDQITTGLENLKLSSFSTAAWHAPRARRTHVLEINSLILHGKLEARWTFSRTLHQRATIEALAQTFLSALRSLIAPSRFALAGSLVRDLECRFPEAEDAYPLSPMQRLFLALESARPASGNDQWHCRLSGPLDVSRLQTAWREVLQRHPALRTAYLSEAEPLAVIQPNVSAPWRVEDWRDVPSAEQERRFSDFLQHDAAQPFDLTQPPLTRLALFRTAEQEHRFVWTHHHLEIDGWSWPLVFREVSALCAAESLPAVRPYRDYIAWLAAQPGSESFWRERLRGFRSPTALPLAGGDGSSALEISRELTIPLEDTARRSKVTVNALCQAAWALLLAHHAKSNDVVFGAAVSGRPAELDGAESIVGHFVNNVPVRFGVDPAETFTALAQRAHRQLADLATHQFAALTEIQSCSELPWNARLFSSLFIFQNYQTAESPWRFGEARVESLHAPVRTAYPLTIVLQPRPALRLTLIAQPRAASRESLEALLSAYSNLLTAVGRQPDAAIATFNANLPDLAAESPRPQLGTPLSTTSLSNTEQMIAAVWMDALQRPFTPTDNFFDIGGHSLLMLQVHRRLCAKLGRDLPLVTLFQHPTIRSLARFLSGPAAPTPAIAAAKERAAKARAALARQPPRTK